MMEFVVFSPVGSFQALASLQNPDIVQAFFGCMDTVNDTFLFNYIAVYR
jgi:hypothetical protein